MADCGGKAKCWIVLLGEMLDKTASISSDSSVEESMTEVYVSDQKMNNAPVVGGLWNSEGKEWL